MARIHFLAAFLLNLLMLAHGMNFVTFVNNNTEHSEAVTKLNEKINELNGVLSNLSESLIVLKSLPQGCAFTEKEGFVSVQLQQKSRAFRVYCDQQTEGGGWTVVLQRSTDRQRTAEEYRYGYYDYEFFMGVEKLYALVQSRPHEVLFVIKTINSTQTMVQAPRFLFNNLLAYNDYVNRSLSAKQNLTGWLTSLEETQKNDEWMRHMRGTCQMAEYCGLDKFLMFLLQVRIPFEPLWTFTMRVRPLYMYLDLV